MSVKFIYIVKSEKEAATYHFSSSKKAIYFTKATYKKANYYVDEKPLEDYSFKELEGKFKKGGYLILWQGNDLLEVRKEILF